MDLTRLWKKRREKGLRLPGTIDDFVRFLGAESQEELESMSPDQLQQLPHVKNNLISRGEMPSVITKFYKWETTENAPNRQEGEMFVGMADTYEEAAFKGLVFYWTLVSTYKARQQETLKIKKHPMLDR